MKSVGVTKTNTQPGFTIVELLIVIVVIAILAAISIVAFTGIQERARNSQTVGAVTQWAKILKLYAADHSGLFPARSSCLGGVSDYKYGYAEQDESIYQCRQDTSSSGLTVNSSFMAETEPYVGGQQPVPAMVTVGLSSYPWYRGAYFYPAYTGSGARIDFVLDGSDAQCPVINGTESSRTVFANGVRCLLRLGPAP